MDIVARRAMKRGFCRQRREAARANSTQHLEPPEGFYRGSRRQLCLLFRPLSTSLKSNSTGVERPRICTATCRRFFS